MRHIHKIALWRNVRGGAHRLVDMLVKRVAFARFMAVCMITMCCTGCWGTRPHGGIPNVGNSCCVNAPMQIVTRLYPDAFEQNDVRRYGQVLFNKYHDDEGHVTQGEAQAFYSAVIGAGGNLDLEAGRQQDARDCLETMDEQFQRPLPPCRFYQRLVDRDNPRHIISDWRAMNATRLLVDIPQGVDGTCTMQDVLRYHFQDTIVPYRTDGPESPQDDVMKQWRIAFNNSDERPLPIFVKRFGLNEQGDHVKDNTEITNTFTFTLPATSQYDGVRDADYTLVGFVVHYGTTLRSGHYTAYVLQNGQWRHYNDAAVRCVDVPAATLAAQQGYLFFYRRSAEALRPSDATGERDDDAAAQLDDMASKRRMRADAVEVRAKTRGGA